MLYNLQDFHIHQKVDKIKKYYNHCPVCLQNQRDRQQQYSEMKRIDMVPTLYHTITMDFIIDIPTIPAEGTFQAIPGHQMLDNLLIINYTFSKKTLLITGSKIATVVQWAAIVLQAILYYDQGLPACIISNRDPKFTSDIQIEICKVLKVS